MARTSAKPILKDSVFSGKYWKEAAKEVTNVRSLVFAALIVALRVAVKGARLPAVAGVNFTLDCYVNAMGSIVYGPLVGLMVGAISDTLGCIFFPMGAYFFPFIFVEMWSSFVFGLFLWRRKITAPKALTAKFLINMVGNVMMNSIFIKWSYYLVGDDKFYTYNLINGVRIVKNLIMFPLEAILIVILISALLPAMKQLKVVPQEQEAIKLRTRDIVLTVVLLLVSIALIVLYVAWLKPFMDAHNFKFL